MLLCGHGASAAHGHKNGSKDAQADSSANDLPLLLVLELNESIVDAVDAAQKIDDALPNGVLEGVNQDDDAADEAAEVTDASQEHEDDSHSRFHPFDRTIISIQYISHCTQDFPGF